MSSSAVDVARVAEDVFRHAEKVDLSGYDLNLVAAEYATFERFVAHVGPCDCRLFDGRVL